MDDEVARGTRDGGPTAADAPFAPAGSRRRNLYANAFFVWVNQAGTGLAGFAFWALAARLYDADDVGKGAATFSVLALLSLLSTLGLGLGLIRFYPEAGAGGPRLTNVALTGSALAAVLTAALFLAGLPVWAPRLDYLLEQPHFALAFILFVVAGALSITQVHAFLSVRQGKYIALQVLCIQVARLCLAAVMVGAFGIVAASGLAFLLGALISFVLLVKAMPGYRPAPVWDPGATFRLLPFSLANYLANLLIMAPALLLPLMVVNLAGATDGAHFYAAWFLGYLPISFSTSLGTSLFAEGSHDPGALNLLQRNAVIAAIAAAAVSSALLLILGGQILLAFGRDYAEEGTGLVRIVVLAGLPAAVVNVYLGALRVMKRNWELVSITGITALATLALSRALIPGLGPQGAALAHGLGQGIGLAIVIGRLLGAAEGSARQRFVALFAAPVPAVEPQSAAGDGHS